MFVKDGGGWVDRDTNPPIHRIHHVKILALRITRILARGSTQRTRGERIQVIQGEEPPCSSCACLPSCRTALSREQGVCACSAAGIELQSLASFPLPLPGSAAFGPVRDAVISNHPWRFLPTGLLLYYGTIVQLDGLLFFPQ